MDKWKTAYIKLAEENALLRRNFETVKIDCKFKYEKKIVEQEKAIDLLLIEVDKLRGKQKDEYYVTHLESLIKFFMDKYNYTEEIKLGTTWKRVINWQK